MGMKFSSIVDRHVGREEEEEKKKERKIAERSEFSRRSFLHLSIYFVEKKKKEEKIYSRSILSPS